MLAHLGDKGSRTGKSWPIRLGKKGQKSGDSGHLSASRHRGAKLAGLSRGMASNVPVAVGKILIFGCFFRLTVAAQNSLCLVYRSTKGGSP
jgi:hypothetical protein